MIDFVKCSTSNSPDMSDVNLTSCDSQLLLPLKTVLSIAQKFCGFFIHLQMTCHDMICSIALDVVHSRLTDFQLHESYRSPFLDSGVTRAVVQSYRTVMVSDEGWHRFDRGTPNTSESLQESLVRLY